MASISPVPGDAGAAAAMDDGDGGSLSPPPTPGKKRLHDDPFIGSIIRETP